jgi:ABC-type transport system substrate-binding protein
MRSIELRLCVATSLLCIVPSLSWPSAAIAATEPKYGGTLRVELRAASVNLDPRQWKAGSLEYATDEKLAALVFERLVALDNYGRFQPVLAAEWSHDGSFRRWQFTIRANVKFSDGSLLSSTNVVDALQPLLPDSLKVSASGNAVVIQSASPAPDLLEQLASGRYFVYRVAQDGVVTGTGPFVLAAAATDREQSKGKAPDASAGTNLALSSAHAGASHVFFRANEDAWSGRPFLNAVDVTLGVPALRAMFDLQLGKADLIELAPDLVPRATQANLRVWTSDSVTLYGLSFDGAQVAASDRRLRESLSLSLDRTSMATVLLQRQAQPASALLPQWLSGYAFLFSVETNLDRAKELRRALPSNAAAGSNPLRLRVDPAGDMAKLLGERVAVNARQASLLVQVVSRPVPRSGTAAASTDPPPATHLFAWRYSSLSPRAELDSMLAAYNLEEPQEANVTNSSRGVTDPEQLYARERRVLDDWHILPLVEQPESVGLAAAVRDWMPARWGEWHLEEVWLEGPSGAAAETSANPPASGAKP